MTIDTLFRGAGLVILVVMSAISGYHRHRAEKKGGPVPTAVRGQPSIPLRIVVGIAIWGAILLPIVAPDAAGWSQVDLPPAVRFAGLGLALVALPLIGWLFRSIGTNISSSTGTRAGGRLVTHGPYRWIRHPLYTFGPLAFLGLALMLESWLLLAVLVVITAWLPYRARREEEYLIASYGEEYRSYMTRTGRFFPRFIGA